MDTAPEQHASSLPGLDALNELPVKGADAVDALVDLIRVKAVRPLTLTTRAIVFGIIVATAAVVTVTLVSITLIRLLTVYAFPERVWISDLLVGAVFVIIGLVAWSKRIDRSAGSSK
jgi:hypothetical protein